MSPRDTECVGLSSTATQIFSDDGELRAVQREVFRQNEIAERLHRDNPDRPLVSFVYFAGMTYTDRNWRYPHAQAEELAGLAVRQDVARKQSAGAAPLLRIVIANGGTAMKYATWVVEHKIRNLLRTDPTLAGSDCVNGKSPEPEGEGRNMVVLCEGLARLRHDIPDFAEDWPGDRTGIPFDVAELFLAAVRDNRARPEHSGAAVNRAAIGLELRRGDLAADTVTGRIRFDGPDGQDRRIDRDHAARGSAIQRAGVSAGVTPLER